MIHWYVYEEDVNARTIEVVDLLSHPYMKRELPAILEQCNGSKDEFAKLIRTALMYQYWARCEYEIILTGWPPPNPTRFKDLKIDIFDQVSMNWDAFIDYIWTHREEIGHD